MLLVSSVSAGLLYDKGEHSFNIFVGHRHGNKELEV